ncbi:siroheme synthase CysG [Methylobrevis albus]|uniref:Uroporphyrinogen-III C-methyltransferase n=1 Tax=Methylobrevis albus TaxID=2793297 RepID=A0A931I3Q4_9HYPH|nr:siroheme synthase CysG [Methylobrevis albus]MBH0239687.1 uroporphyrinogen-III C-methyltransferase [Methylobrevis albus]
MRIASRRPAETAPARMGRLAKLPVFFGLDGRRAVIAGGTAAAAWKAELVAATGARVEVYAADAEPEMLQLVEGDDRFVLHVRPWALDCFAGAAIAICDAADDAEAQAFACAARAAGVPHNVIDKPAFCAFQFGSIVNRSPVVIGISTDGAAPILGQAIRRRIETLVPPTLTAWAELAAAVRERVTHRLKPGAERRSFWERFSDLAFGAAPGDDADATVRRIEDAAAGGMAHGGGRVTIVGAGPGDAEFLTLKAVRALQGADVILFDDLVSDGVLELARREAKRMLVGKRGGRESCKQEDINALMVQLASQGRHVVRLKSGDPMIFGRAGEEISELQAAGIPVEIVPGVTSGLALAASLGVSLTHRDLAHSVRFVTGHSRDGRLPEKLDWHGLADKETTLVVYMGGRTSRDLASRLIAEGRAPATPVVVAESVSRPDQRIRHMILADLAGGAVAPPQAPLLIGIGEVFRPGAVVAEAAPVGVERMEGRG